MVAVVFDAIIFMGWARFFHGFLDFQKFGVKKKNHHNFTMKPLGYLDGEKKVSEHNRKKKVTTVRKSPPGRSLVTFYAGIWALSDHV